MIFQNSEGTQPLISVEKLKFENNVLFFEGYPSTSAVLIKDFKKKQCVESIDLYPLKFFYELLLYRFRETRKKDMSVEEIITIHYEEALNADDLRLLVNSILKYNGILGLVDRGRQRHDILPILVFMGTDIENKAVRFASPYMLRVIQDVYKADVRISKTKLTDDVSRAFAV